MSANIQRLKDTVKQQLPGIVPLVRRLRQFAPSGMITKPGRPIAAVFSRVYDMNYWAGAQSRSGAGSDLTQTAVIRAEIPKLIQDFNVRSMLDIPCGDFFWMKECALPLETYIGADVVRSMIEELNAHFGDARRRFEIIDLTKDRLPRVDLVFCRDAMVHFSSGDIRLALANLKQSGSTYLLATTFSGRTNNPNIATGGNWRPLNLQIPPFSFPPPQRLINEGCTQDDNKFTDKSLGLWRVADL